MRVLVACEYSGAVRRAFRALGHEAWSCDLLPAEDGGQHYQGDALKVAYGEPWDLMVAHPPCTYLAVSGMHWTTRGLRDPALTDEAMAFVMALAKAPIPRIAIENPVSVIATRWREPDQVIHPWQHGHGEVKATCLWLKGLPPLLPTRIVAGREPRVHRMPPGEDRWKERSRTYEGIARAMASQWGDYSDLVTQAEAA